jgi:hypothetical protein
MDMTTEDFNDDSCHFSPSDGSVDEEDCNLDKDEYIPEPSLPMLYNDATMRYAQGRQLQDWTLLQGHAYWMQLQHWAVMGKIQR